MSKTPVGKNMKPSNTLFNYFQKSPAVQSNQAKEGGTNSTSASKKEYEKTKEEEKHCNLVEDMDDNEPLVTQPKKRRRLIIEDSSDSETENKNPSNHDVKQEKIKQKANASLAGLESFECGNVPNETCIEEAPGPAKKKQKTKDSIETQEATVWEHERLDFLKPQHIRDAQKRKPNHPDYDPRTLYVPQQYLDSLTPAMRQWWELKSQHFDCILFFKVGKFYELYHMDAGIGVNELKFTYMKGNFAHSGFPEQAYDKMATELIDKGYKVARVEQTETPEMMNERVKQMKKATKFDKVSRREICQIAELGTQVYTQQTALTDKPETRLLLALNESSSETGFGSRVGVAFVDTSICDVYLAEFDDDQHSSRLLTLLAHYNPVLILHERNNLTQKTLGLLRTILRNSKREALTKDTQMLSAEKTLKTLKEFYSTEDRTLSDTLKALQKPDDSLGLTPADDCKLMLKSLGGMFWYLQNSFIDQQVFDTANFIFYSPPDTQDTKKPITTLNPARNMVLDAIALHNLRVVRDEFSLYKTLDYCCTKFGKRLLHDWLCIPSAEKDTIILRQTAVKEMFDNGKLLQDVRSLLAQVPDLERLVAVLHGFGNKKIGHPDTRAVLYCTQEYNKKKIGDLVVTLKGFEALLDLPQICSESNSELLKMLTQLKPEGKWPNMKDTINYFKNTFNFDEARKEGTLAPEKGDDEEFDAIENNIESLNKELDSYLKKQEKYFGCKLSYFGSDKKRFQIEVPETNAKKADSEYVLESQTKGKKPVKRYYTEKTKDFLKRMQQLENQRKAVMVDFSRRIFAKFSCEYKMWKECIALVAELDVLSSLAEYARNQNTVCVPEIVDNGPLLLLKDSYHPCLSISGDFIPNGVQLGGNKAPLALLTGPNMGGKSTLMRQVGLLSIMVQIGALIPAQECKITLTDRIFTRLGVQDDIIAGQSTFLIELSETSAILKYATANSLVLMDELGRGTSTYDGNAIAGAVVNYLAEKQCRCLFSTHYHNLVDNFSGNERVALGHMACMVENEDSEDPTQEAVTFLYKYIDGPCPKSYGFNAAKLAGMPHSIIRRAYTLSKQVEAIALRRKLLSKLISGQASDVQDCILKLKLCAI